MLYTVGDLMYVTTMKMDCTKKIQSYFHVFGKLFYYLNYKKGCTVE